jgi:hypothetical protein
MKAKPYHNKKTGRPGSVRQEKPYTRNIILAQLDIEEGFKFMDTAKREKAYMFGEAIDRDWKRWNVLRSCTLKCYRCGCRATHWQVEKHRNDYVRPFNLNLYAGKVMLTWDHIVPKSLGGSDAPVNGRVACEPCNGHRGNEMTLKEMLWTVKQDPNVIFTDRETSNWHLELLTWDARFHAVAPFDSKAIKYGHYNPYFGAAAPLEAVLVIDAKTKRVSKELSRSDYARYEQLGRQASSLDLQEQ